MIDLNWVVLLNNTICILACLSCFLHALHGGIYTTNLAKLVLFMLGIGFYSTTMTVEQVIMPGYKYILVVNVFIGLLSITFFLLEAYRSGCINSWANKVRYLLLRIHTGGEHARHKHH